MRAPSGEKAALRTTPSWPRNATISSPVVGSQIRAVPSREAVTMRAPSEEKDALDTESSWPHSAMISSVVFASQIRAVRSVEAVTMRAPSGEKDAPHTWPWCTRRRRSAPGGVRRRAAVSLGFGCITRRGRAARIGPFSRRDRRL
jgi:hypothetical protein